jgi:bifunctional non-homologous end joining protein LigD
VLAKDASSTYRAGQRTDAWLKVKVRAEDEFVIGGFTAPRGSRHHFGALLLGVFENGRLRYVGKAGTGFSSDLLDDLARRMKPLIRATSPFADVIRERGVTWLEPKLVGQFVYAEMTQDRRVRQAAFLGLREDKPAKQVRTPMP